MSDDFVFIVNNEATWLSVWAQDSYRAAGLEGAPLIVYRPFGVALLASLKGLFGVASPIPYRALAVVLHAVNALLLLRWLSGLGLPLRRAIVASLLWSIMPIHAETLYWAVGLFDVTASTALLGALALATRPTLTARLLAVAIFMVAVLFKETAMFGGLALLFTFAFCITPHDGENERVDTDPDAQAPLAMPAAVGVLAAAAWWTARAHAGVQRPEVPLDWNALVTSLGEAAVRAVGFAEELRAAGPPLHGITFTAAVALVLTGLFAWAASRQYSRVMFPVLSLSAIAIAQVLFGQSQIGFLVDPDRYFYLTAAVLPVSGACAWQQPAEASARLTRFAMAGVVLLLAVWSWSALAARAHYDTFEAMLSREIGIGRVSGYVYFLRGVERTKRNDPCSAEMDFRLAYSLETSDAKRAQALAFGQRAEEACVAAKANAVKKKHGVP